MVKVQTPLREVTCVLPPWTQAAWSCTTYREKNRKHRPRTTEAKKGQEGERDSVQVQAWQRSAQKTNIAQCISPTLPPEESKRHLSVYPLQDHTPIRLPNSTPQTSTTTRNSSYSLIVCSRRSHDVLQEEGIAGTIKIQSFYNYMDTSAEFIVLTSQSHSHLLPFSLQWFNMERYLPVRWMRPCSSGPRLWLLQRL